MSSDKTLGLILTKIVTMESRIASIESRMVTKFDLKDIETSMATKLDLKKVESELIKVKSNLKDVETRMATKADLKEVESRMASKNDLSATEARLQTEIVNTRNTVIKARDLLLEQVYSRLENVETFKKKLEQIATG